MNVALPALDASVVARGRSGELRIALNDFRRLSGDHPGRDTNLPQSSMPCSTQLASIRDVPITPDKVVA